MFVRGSFSARFPPARALCKKTLIPYFSRSKLFPACIVSRLFARVNTAITFLCGLPGRVGLFLFLGAVTAQPIQNAALALQGKAVLCHQVGTHFVHEVAVQMIDAAALHALQVQMFPAVAAFVHILEHVYPDSGTLWWDWGLHPAVPDVPEYWRH